jgi:hypothetical protein
MESRAEHIAHLESLLRDKEEEFARMRAELIGLRERVALLRRDEVPTAPFIELSYSGAVVHVLARAGEPLAPRVIHERLVAERRHDHVKSLGGILQALKRRGRVEQTGRGRWTALP